MNQPGILLKATVVASSLLLVGGLVFYRAGAFKGLLEFGGTAQAGIVPGAMSVPPDTPDTRMPSDTGFSRDSIRGSRPFFGGSKSLPDMIRYEPSDTTKDAQPDTPRAERPDTVRRRERHMGGSKSLAPMIELPEPDSQKAASGKSRP